LEELVNAAVDYDKQEENGLRDFIDHRRADLGHGQIRPQRERDDDDRSRGKGLEFPSRFSGSAWKTAFSRMREASTTRKGTRRRTSLHTLHLTGGEDFVRDAFDAPTGLRPRKWRRTYTVSKRNAA
jgi:hypothetical protein